MNRFESSEYEVISAEHILTRNALGCGSVLKKKISQSWNKPGLPDLNVLGSPWFRHWSRNRHSCPVSSEAGSLTRMWKTTRFFLWQVPKAQGSRAVHITWDEAFQGQKNNHQHTSTLWVWLCGIISCDHFFLIVPVRRQQNDFHTTNRTFSRSTAWSGTSKNMETKFQFYVPIPFGWCKIRLRLISKPLYNSNKRPKTFSILKYILYSDLWSRDHYFLFETEEDTCLGFSFFFFFFDDHKNFLEKTSSFLLCLSVTQGRKKSRLASLVSRKTQRTKNWTWGQVLWILFRLDFHPKGTEGFFSWLDTWLTPVGVQEKCQGSLIRTQDLVNKNHVPWFLNMSPSQRYTPPNSKK